MSQREDKKTTFSSDTRSVPSWGQAASIHKIPHNFLRFMCLETKWKIWWTGI